jgi:hypothetical protein
MMSNEPRVQFPESKRVLARKLDAAGWGLFFVWVGLAFLASVGWGVGLLGVGIITLGGQLARKYVGLPLEGFSLVIGAMFLFGGLWELVGLHVGRAPLPTALVPILFIIAGALLLLSAFRRRPADGAVR